MSTAIHVLMIALMVQSGLAVKCYNCDSESNPGCKDMTDANLKAEECDYEKQEKQFNDHDRHWLLKISDIYFRRSPNRTENITMGCQKLVGIGELPPEFDSHGRAVDGISPADVDSQKRTVVRRCQHLGVECDYSERQLLEKLPKGFQIEFCETCEDMDACNGSTNNRIFGVALGVAVVVAACRHLSL